MSQPAETWVVEVEIDQVIDYAITLTGVDVVVSPPQVDAIEIYKEGPPGPPGPPGAANIGGMPTQITDAQAGDVLSFTGAAWTNRGQVDLTDGGNF